MCKSFLSNIIFSITIRWFVCLFKSIWEFQIFLHVDNFSHLKKWGIIFFRLEHVHNLSSIHQEYSILFHKLIQYVQFFSKSKHPFSSILLCHGIYVIICKLKSWLEKNEKLITLYIARSQNCNCTHHYGRMCSLLKLHKGGWGVGIFIHYVKV